MVERPLRPRLRNRSRVEEGNFFSRERLLSRARPGDIIIPFDQLLLGLDWGRASDQTIATIGNDQNDALDWFAYPADHPLAPAFEEQTIKLVREYKRDGGGFERPPSR